jgi:hypothetical protein
MISSRTLFASLDRIFRYGDEDEKQMQAQFARIAVLYNDLALETAGANEESIPLLDKSGMNARRFYFVRRSIATVSELRSAIRVLNANKTFQARKSRWEKVPQREWTDLVRFFEQNHEFLKNWRNDIGGHFEDRAALFAIDNLENMVGALELYRRGDGADVRAKFAYELVAAALVKNREAERQTVEDFLLGAFRFLQEAVHHSENASRIIMVTELLDKFRDGGGSTTGRRKREPSMGLP